jgi:hypothetical protein
MEVATLGVGDQAIGQEPTEHLAGRLGRHAQVAGDLGGGDPPGVVDAGHDAQGEEILLGGRRQVALIVAS